MSRSKGNRLLPVGLLMLSGGLLTHNLIHGRYSEFAGSFLIGVSLVFMVAGLVERSRQTS